MLPGSHRAASPGWRRRSSPRRSRTSTPRWTAVGPPPMSNSGNRWPGSSASTWRARSSARGARARTGPSSCVIPRRPRSGHAARSSRHGGDARDGHARTRARPRARPRSTGSWPRGWWWPSAIRTRRAERGPGRRRPRCDDGHPRLQRPAPVRPSRPRRAGRRADRRALVHRAHRRRPARAPDRVRDRLPGRSGARGGRDRLDPHRRPAGRHPAGLRRAARGQRREWDSAAGPTARSPARASCSTRASAGWSPPDSIRPRCFGGHGGRRPLPRARRRRPPRSQARTPTSSGGTTTSCPAGCGSAAWRSSEGTGALRLELVRAHRAGVEGQLHQPRALAVLREVLDLEALEEGAQVRLHALDAQHELGGDLAVGGGGGVRGAAR